MSSHRYFWFYLCIMALPVTCVSARAPSEDTPIDQIVSCIYPMSGQWFTNVVFGLAMPYSTAAFVHIIVIYATHGWNLPILDLHLDALLLKPMYSVYNQDGRAVMTPVACICLISMVPWVIITEYSLRSIPVEEMSFAIGQWAPWVAALFAIIGGGIYHVVKVLKNGEGALELRVNSPEDYVMSGALIESGGDIPIDDLLAPGRRDDTVSLDGFTHLLEEIDLGSYRTTSEPEG
ncbi:hypothetical protein VE02_03390 [Pseudogymnoascus sp. 03VT05]|nr:hypothetical protein VE02_03390 [Pseudogymnoascus sp. 03VT05]